MPFSWGFSHTPPPVEESAQPSETEGVRLRLYFAFVRDLFNVLPQSAPGDWEELANLSPDRPTVILVSGFAATWRSLAIMRKRLRKDGFNVLILSLNWENMSDGIRGLYSMAEQLSTLALKIRKHPKLSRSRIFLVAHSAGGLVARYYVQLLGGWHYCDRLITLGTPHSGTWVAGLGFFTHLVLKAACLFHMLPISPLIRKINSVALPRGFHLISIHSSGDFLCYPAAAELPEELQGHADVESVELRDLSHSDFLLSKRCYRTLRKYLPGAIESAEAESQPG